MHFLAVYPMVYLLNANVKMLPSVFISSYSRNVLLSTCKEQSSDYVCFGKLDSLNEMADLHYLLH